MFVLRKLRRDDAPADFDAPAVDPPDMSSFSYFLRTLGPIRWR
jgi:hypothetical protein